MRDEGKDGPSWSGARELSADDAERLVAGLPGPAGTEALAELIAVAAMAPRHPDSAGYDLVRQAYLDAGTATARRRPAGLPLGRLVTLKVAAITAVLTVAGTVAAEAGALPKPIQQVVYNVFGDEGIPDPNSAPPPSMTHSAGDPTTTASKATKAAPVTPARPSASSEPTSGHSSSAAVGDGSPFGLCWDASGKRNKQAGDSEHHKLVVLAGGEQNIAAYCADILNPKGADTPAASAGSAAPSDPAKTHAFRTPGSPVGNGRDKTPKPQPSR